MSSERDILFNRLVSPTGEITWPADKKEADSMARQMFGAVLVGCADAQIRLFERLLKGEGVPSKDEEYEELKAFIAHATEDEKNILMVAIKMTARNCLYSLCGKLDQFPGADVKVILRELGVNEGREHVVAANELEETRHEYFDWIEKYSDYCGAE